MRSRSIVAFAVSVSLFTLGVWAAGLVRPLPESDRSGSSNDEETGVSAAHVPDSLIQRICEAPQNLTGPVSIGGSPYYVYSAATVWDGAAYGVVWSDIPVQNTQSQIYFARVAADGTVLAGPTHVTAYTSQANPYLAWTGTVYGLLWYHYSSPSMGLHFVRLDTSGCLVGNDVLIPLTNVADGSVQQCFAWNGSEYGLAWVYDNGFKNIYVARLSSEGELIPPEGVLTSGLFANQINTNIVWGGGQYGLVWEQDDGFGGESDIYFARLNATVGKIGGDHPIAAVTQQFEQEPCIAWTGTEYGVAWVNGPQVYLARLDSEGTKLGDDTLVTDAAVWAHFPSLAWTSAEYGITWQDQRAGGANTDIYFARVSAAGTKFGDDLAIGTAPAWEYNSPKALAFGTKGFGQTWAMAYPSPVSIRFAGLGCHADTTPPSCPVSPVETGRTNIIFPEEVHTVTLGWGPSQDYETEIARYVITRDGVDVGTTADRTWTDTAFDPAAGHVYWITALNALGYGSAGCSGSVDTSDHTPPTCPSNLLGTLLSGGTAVMLTWLPSTDAKSGLNHYRVYRNNIFMSDDLHCFYSDVSLTAGSTYNYAVTSIDWAGNEQTACQSLWVSASPITLKIHKEPDGLNAHLEWNDVNLSEYVIYRSTSPQVAAELERVAPTEAMDPVLHDGVRLWYYFIQQKE
jgi:hypothetical protein